jgi:hypothetical protein
MLRKMLESSRFDKDSFLCDPAMVAAEQILQWGDLSRLKMLFLGNNISPQLHTLDFFRKKSTYKTTR